MGIALEVGENGELVTRDGGVGGAKCLGEERVMNIKPAICNGHLSYSWEQLECDKIKCAVLKFFFFFFCRQ